MSEPLAVSPPTPRQCAAIVFLLVLLVAVPAAITLTSVDVPGNLIIPSQNPTPHGYTVSLLLFIVPILAIAFWLIPQQRLKMPRRAFWITMAILIPLGCGLDFFFAHLFFVFHNAGATLGISAPALGGSVPIEEYIFYVTGFLTALLLYIWFDEYWLRAYQVPDETTGKLFKLHWISLILGLLLIIAATVFKKVTGSPGFPGYFTFIVLMSFVPTSLFLPVTMPMINWRAFSTTLFFTVLVALLWEVTLAAPYGWWGYQHDQMLGIYIKGWSGLPLEAVLVWVSLTQATVIWFHFVKLWLLRRAAQNGAVPS
jgi:hypothetical protein